MMKKTTFLIIAIVYLLPAFAQDIGSVPESQTLTSHNLYGRVKSVYEINYIATLQERMQMDSTMYMDTLLTRNKEVNMTFNQDGLLESYKVDTFDAEGKPFGDREIKYYYNGNTISGIAYYESGRMTDSTYIDYDRRGRIDEQVFYDRKGRKEKTVQYFHRNGNIFNVKERDKDGLLLHFIRYEYDTGGRLKEQEINGNSMQYLYSYKYQYDTLDSGKIQVNKYDYIGLHKYRGMVSYVQDSAGNIIEWTVADSNKRVTDYRTMVYNGKNLPEAELIFKQYKYDYTYHYEYDHMGNWKTKYTYEAGKPIAKAHRVVEFYTEEEPATQ